MTTVFRIDKGRRPSGIGDFHQPKSQAVSDPLSSGSFAVPKPSCNRTRI